MSNKSKRLLGAFLTLALALSLPPAFALTATADGLGASSTAEVLNSITSGNATLSDGIIAPYSNSNASSVLKKYDQKDGIIASYSNSNILNGDVLIGNGTINSGGIVGDKYIPANNGNYGIIVDNSGENFGGDIAPDSNANTSNNPVHIDGWYYGDSSSSIEGGDLVHSGLPILEIQGNALTILDPSGLFNPGTLIAKGSDGSAEGQSFPDALVASTLSGILEISSVYGNVSVAAAMWLGARDERDTPSGSIPGTITKNGGYNNVSSISGNAIIANGYGATISAYGGYNDVSSISNNAIIANGNDGAILNNATVFTDASGSINAIAFSTNRGTLFVTDSGTRYIPYSSSSGDRVIVGDRTGRPLGLRNFGLKE